VKVLRGQTESKLGLARCDLVTECDGSVDIAQWLKSGAGATNGHVAIVDEPSENALIDVDTFDLVHVHFYRMPLDEAAGQCHGNSDSFAVRRRLASSDETDIV
jgi:hypothetical protein